LTNYKHCGRLLVTGEIALIVKNRIKIKLQYFYLFAEVGDDGEPDLSILKIGWAHDPVNHPDDYITGNYRQLVCVLAMPGGQELEREVKQRFEEYRVDRGGGVEFYRVSPELISFLQSKLKEFLAEDALLVHAKSILGGPISIPTVELGVVKPRPVPSIAQVDSVRPHSIVEVEPPKDPRHKAGGRK
jgi:hypothetical protein